MELNDEIKIAAPRQQVFDALNDVDILKQSIPGCEDLQKQSETELTATVLTKVGPVKARFKGAVTLSDLNPPESYQISGEGKGGAAGFASGGAKITLIEDGDGTILKYEVSAKVGGKLAQIGSRLIDGTAKKLAGEFFDTFQSLVSEPSSALKSETAPETENPALPESGSQIPRWVLTGTVSMILAAIIIWIAAG